MAIFANRCGLVGHLLSCSTAGSLVVGHNLDAGIDAAFWSRSFAYTNNQELLADFATAPQTRLIAIKVMRVPGNPLIKGTFWLDDVKLTWAQTAAADH
jgi:hypothetical protein